jgi:hypothetical protein
MSAFRRGIVLQHNRQVRLKGPANDHRSRMSLKRLGQKQAGCGGELPWIFEPESFRPFKECVRQSRRLLSERLADFGQQGRRLGGQNRLSAVAHEKNLGTESRQSRAQQKRHGQVMVTFIDAPVSRKIHRAVFHFRPTTTDIGRFDHNPHTRQRTVRRVDSAP